MNYLRPTLVAVALLLCLAFGVTANAAPQGNNRQIEVTAVDPQGNPLPNATFEAQPGPGSPQTQIPKPRNDGGRGVFTGLGTGQYTISVSAPGFQTETTTADLRNQNSANVRVTLKPAGVSSRIIVAATRNEQDMDALPVSATLVDSEDIAQSAAVTADDVLRQVPSFSLFRRTSSLAAHPTAQGVSLRGIGPSGVSRTLVLVDGIPFNDPFGGWVYWTRTPMANIRQIEIVDSSTASVYGNYAMGGTINFATEPPRARSLTLTPRYGGRRGENLGVPGGKTWDGLGSLDVAASDVWRRFGVSFDGSYLNTNGYVQIPVLDPFPTSGNVLPPLRGPVDTKATVESRNFNTRIDYKDPADRIGFTFRGGYFDEDRENAKRCIAAASAPPLACNETNDTLWKYVSGSARTRVAKGELQVRVLGNFENFHSIFLAVPGSTPVRSLARPSSAAGYQAVPSKNADTSAQWSRLFGSSHYVTVGWDWRWVTGESNELAFDATTGTILELARSAGGRQKSTGIFVQDLIAVTSRLQVTLSMRGDRWSSYDGRNRETAFVGTRTPVDVPSLPKKTNSIGSPHAGARYRVTDTISVWGAFGWGFRAPTLNELYRQFAVGQIRTAANFDLGPERLFGGEAGFSITPIDNLKWRTTWFDNRFTNPVSNITTSISGGITNRQRQNIGRTRIRGVQSDLEYQFRRRVQFALGYLYDMARVTQFTTVAPQADLTGNLLPQVPKHRGSARLTFTDPQYGTVSLQSQFVAVQFEDDLNTQRLPGYGLFDLHASRRISPRLDVFFDVQNLFNRTFYVQRNPTTNGPPRLMTAGMRITLSKM